MHARPHQEHTKTHKFARKTVRPTCASKPGCILRVHSAKRVLHLLAVGAGAATQKTHKNALTGQKHRKAALCIKAMVHPEGALCKMGATLTFC